MARPKSQETIEREKLLEEIALEMKAIVGKSIIGRSESEYIFGLYNRYFGTNERQYSCDLCAIRIISALQDLVKNK